MTTIDLTFRDGLSPGIAAMLKRVEDPSPAMRQIADHMEMSTRRRFETSQGPDGKAWVPSLRALRDGGRTLVKKGHLLASITRAFTAISATVGTNLIYARSMQLGDTRSIAIGAHTRKIRSLFGKPLKKPRTIEIGAHSQKRALPPRPFIGLSADDETEIFYILREFLAGKGLTA